MAINIADGVNQVSKISTLDDFFAYTQNTGSLKQSASNLLYGINQLGITNAVPINKDSRGMVFFTRPMLNMGKGNLMRHRGFHPLLTNNAKTVQRYIRCMLDPYLIYDINSGISCPLVNNKLAFIPILTNGLLKLTGWPDVVAPTYTSKQGTRKEQWSMVDGTTEVNESFDMDATFLNMAEDPIRLMFKTWVNYQACVYDGQLTPYKGFEVRNEMDYTTRIYRIVLDKNWQYVKRIACTIASYPVNDPTGATFDFDANTMLTNTAKETNVRFKCMGARYDDAIIVKWFNRAAGYANPSLRQVIATGFQPDPKHNYVPVPASLYKHFNYLAYPLINEETLELQYWVDTTTQSYKTAVDTLRTATGAAKTDTIQSILKQATTLPPYR